MSGFQRHPGVAGVAFEIFLIRLAALNGRLETISSWSRGICPKANGLAFGVAEMGGGQAASRTARP